MLSVTKLASLMLLAGQLGRGREHCLERPKMAILIALFPREPDSPPSLTDAQNDHRSSTMVLTNGLTDPGGRRMHITTSEPPVPDLREFVYLVPAATAIGSLVQPSANWSCSVNLVARNSHVSDSLRNVDRNSTTMSPGNCRYLVN